MTVNAWLNSELDRTNPILMITFGILMTVAGIFVRAFVGSPYRTMLHLDIQEIVPPVWLMTFLWTLSFFTVGCALGFILGYRIGGRDVEKYKGCLFFVLMSVMELCWYPTLFGAELVLISALLSILILFLSIIVTFSFYQISKFAGMIMLFHDIWLIYMLILNCSVLFHC